MERIAAARTYRKARQWTDGLITVNTMYMRWMVGRRALVVPNAVSERYGAIPVSGDHLRRIVVLGAFRRGRTDLRMLREIASTADYDEMILAGPGSTGVAKVVARGCRQTVKVVQYLDLDELARQTGPATIALIPHLVNDYTISQDPMKLYQFLALGMPVVIPRLLCGQHLDPEERIIRVEHGDDAPQRIEQAFRIRRPGGAERIEFVRRHSWIARASEIANRLP